MKKVLGILIALGGVVLGVWLDIWVLLVGGIKQIVGGVSANPVSGGDIAWGIVRIMFSGVGLVVAFILVMAGIAVATSRKLTLRIGRKPRTGHAQVNRPQSPDGWAPPGYPNQPFAGSYPPPGWAPPSTHPNGPYGGPPTSSSS